MLNVVSEKILSGILIAVIFGLVLLQWLPPVNGAGLLAIAGLAWFFRKEELNGWIKLGLFLVLVPLAFWVATYRSAGFSYPLLFSLQDIGGQASKHDFYINFSKALAGFILLYVLWPRLRKDEFVAKSGYSLTVMLIAPILVVGLAIPVLSLAWQPKPIEQVLLFAAANLLIICVSEEVFMRFLFQQNLRNAMSRFTANRWLQESLPLIAVTIIFVAIHAGLSGAAVWIYALAGFLYGLSYTLSKNIIYPIIVHFLVNQLHFSFLTYPI